MLSTVRFKLIRFRDDVYGGITALTVLVFLTMFVSVGMGIDFMRHETFRSELQDALDRCVLAAAAFSQTVDAQTTCEGYIKSTNFVPENVTLNIPAPVVTTGSRTILVTASYEFDTYFLKLVGMPSLVVQATGSAAEAASKIEVSLALDISTSMSRELTGGTSQTRLEVLRTSANAFVDEIFQLARPGDLTVSLVPFAGHVNVGASARTFLTNYSTENASRCVEFETTDFDYVPKPPSATYSGNHPSTRATMLPAQGTRTQMQHFQYSFDFYTSGVSEIDWGWCPSNVQEIEFMQHDPEALKTRINALRTHEATGTQYGMKWAAALLDPGTSDLTTYLIDRNIVDAQHSDQPRPYADGEVQKFIVIMSDGDTTGQKRLRSQHYQADDGDGVVEENEAAWWETRLPAEHSLGYNVFEDIYSVDRFDVDFSFGFPDSEGTARQAFRNVCDAAKENGVVIFTLGFDLIEGSDAQTDMAYCATSSSHFYDVNGLELSTAFSSIASTIQKLKLLN